MLGAMVAFTLYTVFMRSVMNDPPFSGDTLTVVANVWLVMLAFALSLDDLVLASFVTGPGATTLPIRIYSEVRLGVKPQINAVCTIMIAVVALVLIAASPLTRRRQAQAAAGARL